MSKREAERQQRLLGVLSRSTAPDALSGWVRDGPRCSRGLLAYQANAGALAERALAAAYPVTVQLLGAESFAHLARVLWQQQPPTQGDVATWGAGLADFFAGVDGLADEPCLPDLARLEWAVHMAAGAADIEAQTGAFDRLADTDPAALRLRLRPGTALLQSAHPVASIWRAHRAHQAHHAEEPVAAERFASVRAALLRGQAESALVWRQGWQVHVAALMDDDAAFTHALLQGQTLGEALSALSDRPAFNFEAWLVATLTRGWLLGATVVKDRMA